MFVFINVLFKIDDSDDEVDHKNNIHLEDRIECVKAKIQQLEPSLPTFKQLLLFAGQQLEDGHSATRWSSMASKTSPFCFLYLNLLVSQSLSVT